MNNQLDLGQYTRLQLQTQLSTVDSMASGKIAGACVRLLGGMNIEWKEHVNFFFFDYIFDWSFKKKSIHSG